MFLKEEKICQEKLMFLWIHCRAGLHFVKSNGEVQKSDQSNNFLRILRRCEWEGNYSYNPGDKSSFCAKELKTLVLSLQKYLWTLKINYAHPNISKGISSVSGFEHQTTLFLNRLNENQTNKILFLSWKNFPLICLKIQQQQ